MGMTPMRRTPTTLVSSPLRRLSKGGRSLLMGLLMVTPFLVLGCATGGPERSAAAGPDPLRFSPAGLPSRADDLPAWPAPPSEDTVYMQVIGRTVGQHLVLDQAVAIPEANARLLAAQDVRDGSGLAGRGVGRSSIAGPADVAGWWALMDYWRHAAPQGEEEVRRAGVGKYAHHQQSLDERLDTSDAGTLDASIIRERFVFHPAQGLSCRAGLWTFSEEEQRDPVGSAYRDWAASGAQGVAPGFDRAETMVRKSRGELFFQLKGGPTDEGLLYRILLVDTGQVDRDRGSSVLIKRVLTCAGPAPLFVRDVAGYTWIYERQGRDHVISAQPRVGP